MERAGPAVPCGAMPPTAGGVQRPPSRGSAGPLLSATSRPAAVPRRAPSQPVPASSPRPPGSAPPPCGHAPSPAGRRVTPRACRAPPDSAAARACAPERRGGPRRRPCLSSRGCHIWAACVGARLPSPAAARRCRGAISAEATSLNWRPASAIAWLARSSTAEASARRCLGSGEAREDGEVREEEDGAAASSLPGVVGGPPWIKASRSGGGSFGGEATAGSTILSPTRFCHED